MLVIIAVVLHLSLSAWLLYYMLSKDKGNREPIWALLLACLLGIGSIVLALIGNQFIGESFYSVAMTTHSIPDALIAGLSVGLVEELAKAIPVGLFIYHKKFFNEGTDGVIYFGLAALVFGTLENVMYSVVHGGDIGITRIFMTPFLHVSLTAAVGYYVARWRLGQSPLWKPILVLGGAIGIHALYDASLFALAEHWWLLFLALGLSISTTVGIFFIYSRAHNSDLQLGVASDGVRGFCRSCGRPNPKHDLYCSVCGRKA